MTNTSLDSNSPPAQATRTVIRSWSTEGYQIDLIDTGDRTADIICTPHGGAPELFGDISFDHELDRNFVNWNRAGHTIEDYKRNHWDTKFYYTMAEWARS